MRTRAAHDVNWREGKSAIYVFNAGDDVGAVKKAAYAMFSEENGLGPAAFPSLAQMEREVVDFGLSLLNAPDGAAGAMTSGGTDSIVMAMKAARDYARAQGRGGAFNIVIPASAHPAFDKGAMLMDIEVRRAALKDYLADPAAIEAAMDAQTILIVGSAPCFPYGLIDPIEALSALALRKGAWLHVDACVGGYLAPFVRMNGADLPVFDFSAPGVSSISGDLHKYGYASKGASTVFFRSEALKAHMPFDAGPWPLGRMITPTLAGTRPGRGDRGGVGGDEFPGRRRLSRQAEDGDGRPRGDRGGGEGAGLCRAGRAALGHPGVQSSQGGCVRAAGGAASEGLDYRRAAGAQGAAPDADAGAS
ncbi:MAG: pyridoxal-dependent decarboxylase [Terricaulis sp.]|nr:pyridoxal-dependent decarboxylase [Terricaulis sp.]